MLDSLYFYRAIVISNYDGDSITVDLSLGFDIWVKEVKVRLNGIDTPEIKGEERPLGLISQQYLEKRIDDKEIIIQSIKDQRCKYGRILGVIWLDKVNINQELLDLGLAVPYLD